MINVMLDMDGVLADYESYNNHEKFDRKNFENRVYNEEMFTKLEVLYGARALVALLKAVDVNIEILSSLGAPGDIRLGLEVAHQKQVWLEKNGFGDFPCNFVEHKGLKKRFATPKTILIDDTKQNIYDFNEYYGVGIFWDVTQYSSSKYLSESVDNILTEINRLKSIEKQTMYFNSNK